MSFAQRNQYSVRPKGGPVTVPNNEVARLMYYLDCVCSVIDYDADIEFVRDYDNWSSLSIGGTRAQLSVRTSSMIESSLNPKNYVLVDETNSMKSIKFVMNSWLLNRLSLLADPIMSRTLWLIVNHG